MALGPPPSPTLAQLYSGTYAGTAENVVADAAVADPDAGAAAAAAAAFYWACPSDPTAAEAAAAAAAGPFREDWAWL